MRSCLLPFVLLVCIASSTASFAANPYGGSIGFSGAIVQESCSASSLSDSVTLKCGTASSVYPLSHAGRSNVNEKSNPLVSTMTLSWLDSQHQTGTLTVTYR